ARSCQLRWHCACRPEPARRSHSPPAARAAHARSWCGSSPEGERSRTMNESSRNPIPPQRTLRPVASVHAGARQAGPVLPHHKLRAYGVARELLLAVLGASIRDAKLRDEAIRSAKSACLNCAEGAGRVTRADKARAFAIARAEAVEAAAAVEIASLVGDAEPAAAQRCIAIADRLVALLTGLTR